MATMQNIIVKGLREVGNEAMVAMSLHPCAKLLWGALSRTCEIAIAACISLLVFCIQRMAERCLLMSVAIFRCVLFLMNGCSHSRQLQCTRK